MQCEVSWENVIGFNKNTELGSLAKKVASQCGGLPLGLKTMARSMKGIYDEREWKNALKELEEAKNRRDIESKLFSVLNYSYDHLEDLKRQESFLYCAFFPEDAMVHREELIECLIVEGIIKGEDSWKEKYNEGHVILNELENACLLESWVDFRKTRYVKMHDLIRDMAIKILRERPSVMIKAGVQLKEVPNEECWIDSLVRVSLMENDIEEIPSSHSPRCPKLATILLRSNRKLKLIADSFFRHLHGLKFLVLSDTNIIKLPDSISELVSLVALLLSHCGNLEYIPSLAKLSKLQKLDLSCTGLRELPDGIEMLSNLRYLDFWESKVKELRSGILPNFFRLEVLICSSYVTVRDVASLTKLENLQCKFDGISNFRECMEHLSAHAYNIEVGDFSLFRNRGTTGKYVFLGNCRINTEQDIKAFRPFRKDVEELVMSKCKLPRTFFGDGSRNLVSLPCPSFKSAVSSGSLQSVGIFSCLKQLVIWECDGVKRLFSVGLLSTFQNLECFEVCFCGEMEEIQAMKGEEDEEREGEEDDNDNDDKKEEERCKGEKNNSSNHNPSVEFITLPKLKRLQLVRLPKLTSICSGVLICNSLQEIEILECSRLKRIPLSYPLSSLERFAAFPQSWWESVEWDQLSDKNILQPNLW